MTIANEAHVRLVLKKENLHAKWIKTFDRPEEELLASKSGAVTGYALRVVGEAVRRTPAGKRSVWKVDVASKTNTKFSLTKHPAKSYRRRFSTTVGASSFAPTGPDPNAVA